MPAEEWQAFCDAFASFRRHIGKVRTVNLNSAKDRAEAEDIAHGYFRHARPLLENGGLTSQLEVLDPALKKILELSDGNNAVASYKKQLTAIRKILPKVTVGLELSQTPRQLLPIPTRRMRASFKRWKGWFHRRRCHINRRSMTLGTNNGYRFVVLHSNSVKPSEKHSTTLPRTKI